MNPLEALVYLFTTKFALFVMGGIIFFFLFREVNSWYWKINRQIELLEKIEENTARKD